MKQFMTGVVAAMAMEGYIDSTGNLAPGSRICPIARELRAYPIH